MIARTERFYRGRTSWDRLVAPRSIGIAGIALDIVALWVALPPVTVRSVLLPVLLGICAVAAGIWPGPDALFRLCGCA